jgi:oligopeptide/dipeptide ABC transporter ATP-binding protein
VLEGGLSMLSLERISKVYKVGAFGSRELTAVRDVSFTVRPGELVSLIGESGSGKTTIGRMVLRLTSVSSGRIAFNGVDVGTLSDRQLGGYHRRVQGVFQDPFSSYNPIFRAERVLDVLRPYYFRELSTAQWRAKVDASLEAVRLEPAQVRGKYPHQLSGGQLQRMLIARALLLDIDLLVADEIISMLDASTRIDVLNLLAELKAKGLGVLFITHDLSLGNYVSDTAVILRRGSIVERGATEKVFANPLHPYTKSLLASVPQLHRKWPRASAGAPGPAAAPGPAVAGQDEPCVYHQQYPNAPDRLSSDLPALAEVADDHFVGCARLGQAA